MNTRRHSRKDYAMAEPLREKNLEIFVYGINECTKIEERPEDF